MRRAEAADAANVRALTRQAYAKWVAVIGREPKPMGADYDQAVREHLVDLAYCDGELAGLIEMIQEQGHLLVENVAVAPAFQKRGLGRRLMAHAEEVARSLDYREVRLYTNKRFVENVDLYGRLGYCIDREEATERGVAVYMSKALGR
jgi:ribosomal protein S18 acetylase RimI-like enzyme